MAHPETLGPYRIENVLGSGGMGEVYQAYDTRLDRRVAIKQIRPDRSVDEKARKRFRREARAVAHLSHPAIVQVFDILETGDGDWIVMELVQGSDVAKLVKDGPLDLVLAVDLGVDLAEGLAEAHEAGIIHRDLKGENVMVTPRGRAKMLDFGLAKRLWDSQTSATLSSEGMVIGTCRSMSPEQAKGREVGPASDLFSLGTLLYEMLTGRSPFLSETPGQTLVRVCTYHPPALTDLRPELPEDLATLVKRLHLKDPGKRPPNAGAVAAALREIARSVPGDDTDEVTKEILAGSGTSESDDLLTTESSGILGVSTFVDEPLAAVETVSTESTIGSTPDVATGERRQVTVLHCELSPEDDAALDAPEELPEVVYAFRRIAARVLEPYGVTPRQDDMTLGLTVTFGYPVAHADDPQRAAFAAQEIVDEFLVRRAELAAAGPLAIRVGIHTGFGAVIARDGEAFLSAGRLMQVASGLQGLAAPGGVVISGDTRALLGSSFQYREFEGRIPGMTGPLPVFRLLDPVGDSQLIEMALARHIAQAARTQELEQVLDRWELAREGAGQVVLLSAGAGIGKTRLVASLKARLVLAERLLMEWNCSSYRRHTSYHPLVRFVERVTGESAETFPSPGLPLADFVGRLLEILDSPSTSSSMPLALGPERQARKNQESIAAAVLEMAEEYPLLLVVEDAQWADPSTLGLLSVLLEQVATSRVLLLVSFRREWEPPWPIKSYMTQVNLSPLPRKQAALLVEMLTEDAPLPRHLRDEIVERSDGVPLFIEELTRLVRATGWTKDETAIPPTLQGWLTARLDRLGEAKKLAQLAAFFGREFAHELLRACTKLRPAQLREQLDVLVKAELLHRRGQPPRAVYTFRHALLRDAAYESVLKSRRQVYHQRIARTLHKKFPELEEKGPEVLAYHHLEAGEYAEAVPYYLKAAETATRAATYDEALSYVRKGLQALENLAGDEETRRFEITLQIIRGTALGISRSYALPEVERAFARARELWDSGEKDRELFPFVNSLAFSYIMQGRPRIAHELLLELVRITEEARDADFLPAVYWSMGLAKLMLGEFSSVQHYVEEGIAFYATQLSLEPKLAPGTPLAVATSLGDLSWALWFLGDIDQSLDCSQQSLDMIRHSPDAYTQAFALYRAGYLHVFRREGAAVRELADRLIRFAERAGFLFYRSMGIFLKGQALVWEGRDEEGIWMMSESLDGAWAAGQSGPRTLQLAMLAEACAEREKVPQGLSLVREALNIVEREGDCRFESELHRIQGELLHLQGEVGDDVIEGCFQKALEVALGQSARSLGLRAAVSLGRWWRDRGRRNEARAVLSDVLKELREGLDTPDVRDGQRLLDELSLD